MFTFLPDTRRSLQTIGAVAMIAFAAVRLEADPVRVLLLTGGHPYDYDEFHAMFDQMDDIAVTHVELEDHAEVFEDIGGWQYDTIVFYNMTHELSDRRLENLFTLTEWGVGLVPLHHGTLSWTPQPRVKEIFGVQFPDVGPFGFHLNQTFTYEIIDHDHPVTHEMESFEVIDETYTNWYGEGVEGNRVLIVTDHQPADPELVWSRHVNNSRILSIQGGHDRLTFEDPNYIELLHRAIMWTSGRLPLEVGGEGLPDSTTYREYFEFPALLESLSQYDASQSRLVLTTFERRLVETPSSDLIAALVELANDAELPRELRTWAFRQLGYHGTPSSLSSVAEMLLDEKMANIARYTFEMSVHDEANAYLLDAFKNSSGDIRRGIAITMTRRMSEGVLDALRTLLDSDDSQDIEIGATGLGEIGGAETIAILRAKEASLEGDLLIVLQESLLAAADHAEHDDSARVYSDLKSNGATSVIKGSAWLKYLLSSNQALDAMPEALSSPDATVRAAAINVIPRATSNHFMEPLLDKFSELDPSDQIAVLYGLETRGDSAGLPIVHEGLRSEDEDVLANASYVAGSLGNSDTARALIELLEDAPHAIRGIAIESLAAIPGEDVETIIVDALDSDRAALRVALLETISERLNSSAIDRIFELTTDDETRVRSAAYSALGRLGDDDTFTRVLDHFMVIESSGDLRFASRTLIDLRRSSERQDEQLAQVLEVLPDSTEEQTGLLIGAIAVGSTDAAADALESLLESDTESIRLAAIRSLSSWPSSRPAEALLAISSSDSRREALLAARGYLTVLSRDPDLRSAERLVQAQRIRPQMETAALKIQYISLIASTPSVEALQEVEAFLDDEEVQREAFQAIEQLAPNLALAYPDEVYATLNRMAESPQLPEELRAQANERIEFLAAYRERVIENWNFFDGKEGWLAENQSTLEPRAGYLHAISHGDDPFMSIEVDIEQQPLIVQFRVRHEENPGLFQFFIRTDEVEMGYPGSTINIEPLRSAGEWVEYQVPFTPVGNMEVFRFDFAIFPIEVDIDYIRILKPE